MDRSSESGPEPESAGEPRETGDDATATTDATTRRAALGGLGLAGLTALAGCSILGGDGASGPPPSGRWRQFRGDAANTGAVAGPGLFERPERRWRRTFDAETRSYPPVVDRRRLYTARQTPEGLSVLATRLDGTPDWETTVRAAASRSFPFMALSGRLLVVPADRATVGLDPVTGDRLWTSDARTPPPVVGDGVVYWGLSGVRAIDPVAGTERWRTSVRKADVDGDGTLDTAAYVQAADDSRVYLQGTRSVAAVALDDRTLAWRFADPVEDDYDGSQPVFPLPPAVAGDGLYAVRTNAVSGGAYSRLLALGAADGVVRWRFAPDDGETITTAPVVAGGVVHVVGGPDGTDAGGSTLYALDADSGAVRWRLSLETGGVGSVRSYPARAGNVLYLPGREVVAVDLDAREVRWAGLGRSPDGAVAVGPERVYRRSPTGIAAFGEGE